MKDKVLNIIISILIFLVLGIGIYLLFFNKEPEITSIRLSKNNLNLYVNESEKLDVLLENIDKDNLLWKSDNEEVATVSDGVVKGNSIGSATITIYTIDGKLNDKCLVEVSERLIEKIDISKNNIELLVGNTEKINVTIIPEELKDKELTWSSDNELIAKVDSNGLITAIGKGETVIRVTGDNITNECKVKIIEPEPIIEPKEEPKKEEVVIPKKEEIKPSKMEIHFINAGGYYDDAILIRSDKATIYIDGGRGKDAVVKYLHDLKINTIDYVIGSHTEYDHIDAQGEVIRQFNVKHAIYPNDITKCGCSCESNDVWNVNSALKSKNMQPEVQPVPSKLTVGDMTLYFIAPYKIGCNKNNNSFIFILQFGNNKFMFTGDSDSALNDVNQMLTNAQKVGLSNIEVDLLKYPHHGNQGLNDKFLDNIKTKYVVVPNVNACTTPARVSVDKLNARNAKIYRQCDSKTGNILVTSDGNNINFKMDVEASTYTK